MNKLTVAVVAALLWVTPANAELMYFTGIWWGSYPAEIFAGKDVTASISANATPGIRSDYASCGGCWTAGAVFEWFDVTDINNMAVYGSAMAWRTEYLAPPIWIEDLSPTFHVHKDATAFWIYGNYFQGYDLGTLENLTLTLDVRDPVSTPALVTPIPGALPLFASALVLLGWLVRRRRVEP